MMKWKTVLAGTTALALVGSTLAFAQQQQTQSSATEQSAPGAAGGMTSDRGGAAAPERRDYGRSMDRDTSRTNDQRRSGGAQDDTAARVEQSIARFKQAMRLAPDQEKNWPAFEAAARDLVQMRLDRVKARRDQTPPGSPAESLRRGAEAMSAMSVALKRLADAEEPLYNSLDDGQKQRFAMLSRMARQRLAMLGQDEQRAGGDRSESRGGRDSGGRDSDERNSRNPHSGMMRGDRDGGRGREAYNDDDRDSGWGRHRGMGDRDQRDSGDRRGYGGERQGYGEDRGRGDDGWRGRDKWREGRDDEDERGYGRHHHHHHDFDRRGDRDEDRGEWRGHHGGMMGWRSSDEETTGMGEGRQGRDFGRDRGDLQNRRGDDDRSYGRGGDNRGYGRGEQDEDEDYNL
jgi:hypothetical protein